MKSKNVLLIDSSEDFLDALEYFLHQDPLVDSVSRALPGQDAMEKLESLHPDVVMVDLVLPMESGIKLIKDIKSSRNAPKIIVLTLNDYEQYREMAFAAGADTFVGKNEIGKVLFPTPSHLFASKEELN